MTKEGKGPYSEQDMERLERANQLFTHLLDEADDLIQKSETKTINDPEIVDTILKIAKALTDNVHKTANATSKHDIGNALVESAEDRTEFLKQLHGQATEAFQDMSEDDLIDVIPEEMVPEPVEGQLGQGIIKTTLKDIMDTDLGDD